MNFNSKRTVTDEQNERHKRILASILKEEGNKSCADCKTRNPTWASVNLGVFVCLTCSGIHRSLGVHISQVRSCNLDTWLPKQVEFCRVMGNVKGNRYWEARLPKDFRRPPSGNPNPELASFIRAKYVDRVYAATDATPPTIDNYQENPYASGDDAEQAAAPTLSASAGRQAPSGPSLGTAPAKAYASIPALMVDLLGGFDDITSAYPASPSNATMAPAAAPSNGDPFSYGSFVSAPPVLPSAADPAASGIKRSSLEWTDFHAASPLPVQQQQPPSPQPQQPPLHSLLRQTSGSHQRSYSISEGVTLTAPAAPAPGSLGAVVVGAGAGGSLSRLGAPGFSSGQAQIHGTHGWHGHGGGLGHVHSRHHSHDPSSGHSAASNHFAMNGGTVAAGDRGLGLVLSPVVAASAAAAAEAADPFASLPTADDLLAGLTIHHVMECMSSPRGTATATTVGNTTSSATTTSTSTSTAAPAAAAITGAPADLATPCADPFQFTSSALPGEHHHHHHHPHVSRGPSHRRHPSNAKTTTEEVLRLFDTEPSTGTGTAVTIPVGPAAVAGAGAGAGDDDPFGDFLGAGDSNSLGVAVGVASAASSHPAAAQNGGFGALQPRVAAAASQGLLVGDLL